MNVQENDYVKSLVDLSRTSPYFTGTFGRKVHHGDIYKVSQVREDSAVLIRGWDTVLVLMSHEYEKVNPPSLPISLVPILVSLTLTGLTTMRPDLLNDPLVQKTLAACISVLAALVVGNAGLLSLKCIGTTFAQWGDRRRRIRMEWEDREDRRRLERNAAQTQQNESQVLLIRAEMDRKQQKVEEERVTSEGRIAEVLGRILKQATPPPTAPLAVWHNAHSQSLQVGMSVADTVQNKTGLRRVRWVTDATTHSMVMDDSIQKIRPAKRGDVVNVTSLDADRNSFEYRIGNEIYYGKASEVVLV